MSVLLFGRAGAFIPIQAAMTLPEMCRYSALTGWRCHVQRASQKHRAVPVTDETPSHQSRTALVAFTLEVIFNETNYLNGIHLDAFCVWNIRRDKCRITKSRSKSFCFYSDFEKSIFFILIILYKKSIIIFKIISH